ncbi:MAG: hypothetical protein WKF97_15135 [Chitinophagaceae bacterium]
MKINYAGLILLWVALMNFTKPNAIKENLKYEGFQLQKVGESSKELLSDKTFTALKIEIQYMSGFQPDTIAVAELKSFLYKHLHKPGGISITTKEIAPSEDIVLTTDDLVSIEQINRTAFTSSNEIAVYLLYTNGYYEENIMLGYAYQNTSAVLFGKNVWESSNAIKKPNRTYLETRILQHEVCHLLGLVNVGAPLRSDHKDNDHGKHCINKKCLMYYQTATEEPEGALLPKEIPVLDNQCMDDLRANGGK